MSDLNGASEITGKKVFFLYPTGSVQNHVVPELVQHEYEVYISKDHTRIVRVLKKYSDAVVFINIDEKMSEQDWERWINTIMSSLPEIKIGVFTSSSDENLKDKYVNKIRVACGFVTIKLDMAKTIGILLEILNAINAKGRRKYLRANTEREANATVNMPQQGDYINGSVRDISTVGVSCSFEQDPGLKQNELIKDIQIRLQTMLLKVEAVVFGSRTDNNDKIYVLIFTQRIDPEVRVKIRKYIQQYLQGKMDQETG